MAFEIGTNPRKLILKCVKQIASYKNSLDKELPTHFLSHFKFGRCRRAAFDANSGAFCPLFETFQQVATYLVSAKIYHITDILDIGSDSTLELLSLPVTARISCTEYTPDERIREQHLHNVALLARLSRPTRVEQNRISFRPRRFTAKTQLQRRYSLVFIRNAIHHMGSLEEAAGILAHASDFTELGILIIDRVRITPQEAGVPDIDKGWYVDEDGEEWWEAERWRQLLQPYEIRYSLHGSDEPESRREMEDQKRLLEGTLSPREFFARHYDSARGPANYFAILVTRRGQN